MRFCGVARPRSPGSSALERIHARLQRNGSEPAGSVSPRPYLKNEEHDDREHERRSTASRSQRAAAEAARDQHEERSPRAMKPAEPISTICSSDDRATIQREGEPVGRAAGSAASSGTPRQPPVSDAAQQQECRRRSRPVPTSAA